MLTGQKITAKIQGIDGFTVTSYHWQGVGSGFKNYVETATNNQLISLAGTDLAGGSGPVPDLNFYDAKQEDLTIACDVTLTAPDGTSLTVSAKSPTVSVQKPTANWGIKSGWVHFSSGDGVYGYYGSSTYQSGQTWHDVAVTLPPAFTGSGGTCSFTQLIKPDREAYNGTTATAKASNNTLEGLDGSFTYGNTWTPPAIPPNDGDSPNSPTYSGYTSVAASDSFTTWLMYKPTGGVWIPLQQYSWSWSETLTNSGGTWSLTAGSPATQASAPHYTATDTNDPPTWTLVH